MFVHLLKKHVAASLRDNLRLRLLAQDRFKERQIVSMNSNSIKYKVFKDYAKANPTASVSDFNKFWDTVIACLDLKDI